jgi:hypothetical protein
MILDHSVSDHGLKVKLAVQAAGIRVESKSHFVIGSHGSFFRCRSTVILNFRTLAPMSNDFSTWLQHRPSQPLNIAVTKLLNAAASV